MVWSAANFDEKSSSYEGNLKYSSACYIPERKILFTGGCFTTNQQPSN